MPGRARTTDPATSHQAAANAPTLKLAARYVMALYRLGALSTTEIARQWDMPRDSFSPRTAALVQAGHVYCIGKLPRRNPSGRVVRMNVYDLTTKGRAACVQAIAEYEARLRASQS
jgi:DNA-binding MarR family transcriptional regulator